MQGSHGEERAQWGVTLALEREVWNRTKLFGEMARTGSTTFARKAAIRCRHAPAEQ
jgi:hypothetical protein